jgi:hypothetical protein
MANRQIRIVGWTLVTIAVLGCVVWLGAALILGDLICPDVDANLSITETLQWTAVPLGPSCSDAADQPKLALLASQWTWMTWTTALADVVVIGLAVSIVRSTDRR